MNYGIRVGNSLLSVFVYKCQSKYIVLAFQSLVLYFSPENLKLQKFLPKIIPWNRVWKADLAARKKCSVLPTETEMVI